MATTTTVNELHEVPNVTKTENESVGVTRLKWIARGIGAIVLITVTVAGTMFWLDSRHFESTDDAQVDGHFAALSTRIEGTVLWVNPNVENDHSVKAGDLLLRLDPRDFEVALERAKANLKVRQSQARGARLEVPITDASVFNQLRAAKRQLERRQSRPCRRPKPISREPATGSSGIGPSRAEPNETAHDTKPWWRSARFRDPPTIREKQKPLLRRRRSKRTSRPSPPMKERLLSRAASSSRGKRRSRVRGPLRNSSRVPMKTAQPLTAPSNRPLLMCTRPN